MKHMVNIDDSCHLMCEALNDAETEKLYWMIMMKLNEDIWKEIGHALDYCIGKNNLNLRRVVN